jgi:superfamily II DNA helicase RecQ
MDATTHPQRCIREQVLSVLREQKVELCCERELAGQEARHSPMPWGLHRRLREQLEIERQPLYSHQAAALEHILAGRSVCLATPTGSGKSRVFELAALQTIHSSPAQAATVLVLYPHKSLYLTCRLGLRRGEVYAISRSKLRHIPPQLVVDEQVQMGNRSRPAKLTTRKHNAAYTLELS